MLLRFSVSETGYHSQVKHYISVCLGLLLGSETSRVSSVSKVIKTMRWVTASFLVETGIFPFIIMHPSRTHPVSYPMCTADSV